MVRPSVLPIILPVLEPYLEVKHREFLNAGSKTPTLPGTADGKVNVRHLVRDLMRLDSAILDSHEQHFFRKKELYDRVDRIAEEQGLKAIGSRSDDEDQDAARKRISMIGRETSDLRQSLAEREALIESLRRENAGLRERLGLVEETGMIFRTEDPT
ncbi:hypothetical protein BB934_01800 [Microvirga ossetica]|uniref:Uncharacterized protein n=1 Tax=Microvirga ossetica TaxID=1882682 RepID=A0A1B2EAT7_9HYPH|nr:hypothetical protein [Microvirga ossetica]ANY77106.1 hypothetical protein BB934_01800 [Microvirga ossetica]